MIVSVDRAMAMVGDAVDQATVEAKLRALESLIRDYTNNNFQFRRVRYYAASSGGGLQLISPYLAAGDTVEISDSINEGVYTIVSAQDGMIYLDQQLYDVSVNLVTKVVYPTAVQEGVLNLLRWEINNRDKVGIKSETISRHSVTYYDQDANNQVQGYPVSLMGFLEPYMKMRI